VFNQPNNDTSNPPSIIKTSRLEAEFSEKPDCHPEFIVADLTIDCHYAFPLLLASIKVLTKLVNLTNFRKNV
jgi:hypothetical protein